MELDYYWMRNVRYSISVPMISPTGHAFNGARGHSICVTCEKPMPKCWDTVCHVCGDTSCYAHSYRDDKYWYCEKHKPE